MYVKFRVILRKYGNSAANGKFHGSARNFAARRKVWSLLIVVTMVHASKLSKHTVNITERREDRLNAGATAHTQQS